MFSVLLDSVPFTRGARNTTGAAGASPGPRAAHGPQSDDGEGDTVDVGWPDDPFDAEADIIKRASGRKQKLLGRNEEAPAADTSLFGERVRVCGGVPAEN